MLKQVLVMILAGGKGSRLEPLTRDRAKPAVPFGGIYRIIDFTLSNCINSALRRIYVLTQYKAASLDRHLHTGWTLLSRELGEFIEVLPPQQRIDEHWYKGTADAIYQNIYSIEKEDPKFVLILAGDHIYKMNYASMMQYHLRKNAALTVGCLPTLRSEASGSFGVMEIDSEHRILGFEEKPRDPKPMPDDPERCMASMGIYVFNTAVMYDQLFRDAGRPQSAHDFGRNIIPAMIEERQAVYAYPFVDENRKQALYWRDVGTLDAYYQANMDLVGVEPILNLYDQEWPIRTHQPQYPPPKFVFAQEGPGGRRGTALDSIVSQGCIVSGGRVQHSVLSPAVRINSFAEVEDSILFEGVNVGRHARIRRAIIDKDVKIPAHFEIGYNREWDLQRGFQVTDGGVVVIAKDEALERFQQGVVRQASLSPAAS
jgi:glucose-1-phosphate adenylyltransferase